jgi:hypothetical protein
MNNNIKEIKRNHLDPYEMDDRSFDEKNDAWRVSVVDGITLNAQSITLPEIKFPEQKTIEIPVIIKETEVHQVNVPVIVKEYERIEVPVIVKEIEYRTIEVPVVIREIQVIEVEKPVVIKEIEIKIIEKTIPVMPNYFKVCMIIQTVLYFGLLLTNIFLKGK